MKIHYAKEIQVLEEIEVEDICNCCLEFSNILGDFYYVRTTSEDGFVYVLLFGPIQENYDQSFSISRLKLEASQYKIQRAIESYIQDDRRALVQGQEISVEECKAKLSGLKEYLWQEKNC